MTYVLLTPPVAEPLGLDDVKAHLRLDNPDEEALLTGLITVARDHLERTTGLLAITQSWRLYVDSVCEDGVIQIAKGPLQRLDAARFHDAGGKVVTLDVAAIVLGRGEPPVRITLAGPFPMQGVEVDFTGGFGAAAASVPPGIRQALLLHVAAMYEYRGAVSAADQPAVVPEGYERLIAPFRMRRL